MLALLETFSSRATPTTAASDTNAPAGTNRRTFEVRGYQIYGNTVLPPEDFLLLTNYTGPAVEISRLRQGLGELQLHYRNLGFATIAITLPQQRLTNGYVRVQVVEGQLSRIKVQGSRYYSSNNVLRALPSLTTNVLLNTKWLQPELDQANANPDRQIYPVINPGLEPGTSELTLKVKDRLPLHGHMEINDKGTPNTPLLRIDSALQYNNLWQLEHQIGVEYNFSPQEMKWNDYMPRFYDQPMVASYSGFYRIPLGFGQDLRETYDQMPVDFGYDQVTHQFRLPPPTGRPELIFFASRSASDTLSRFGPLTVLTNTEILEVSSRQFVQRTPTFNDDLGGKWIAPLRDFLGVKSSISAGIDYKSYDAQSFITNFEYATVYTTNSAGDRVPFASYTITNALNSANALHYLPISLGWTGARPDKWGGTSFYWNQNLFFSGLASARNNFQTVAGSTAAGGNYTTLTAGLIRQQQLPADWSAVLNANGQWASRPQISNEQFALGGTSGVRGYREGEAYGDTGWRVLFDLRAPPVNVGSFPNEPEDIPAYLRCSWFMDYGEAYHLDSVVAPAIRQWGTGAGFYLTAGEHFDARLSLAWALRDTPLTTAGSAFAYFSIGFQF